jgi:hypothetical protein
VAPGAHDTALLMAAHGTGKILAVGGPAFDFVAGFADEQIHHGNLVRSAGIAPESQTHRRIGVWRRQP